MSWSPEVLVLGPGGAKGFYIMGALLYLERKGWLHNLKTCVGVSIGAVIALLVSAGYTISEIIDHSLSVSLFHDFMSIDLSQIRENSGLISNNQVKQRLTELMQHKFGLIPSLKQFYDFTAIKYVAVTCNIDKSRAEYLSYETEPDLSVVDAVMLSMNIPFIFYRLRYKGCTYVDGALAHPYPLDVYDDGVTPVLGITIDHNTEGVSPEGLGQYLYSIIHSVTNSMRSLALRRISPCCRSLILEADLTDTLGLSLTDEQKSHMIVSGYEKAKVFVEPLKQSYDF